MQNGTVKVMLVVVLPAPADTTSELLLVEKVLALGLDCPPFAVLAFIPISSHECSEGFRFLAKLPPRRSRRCLLQCTPTGWLLLLLAGPEPRRADYKELPLAPLETCYYCCCCFSSSLFSPLYALIKQEIPHSS